MTSEFRITSTVDKNDAEDLAKTWYEGIPEAAKENLAIELDKNSNPQGQYGYDGEATYDVYNELWVIRFILTHPGPIGPITEEEWLEQFPS